jgi:hypothetical protein
MVPGLKGRIRNKSSRGLVGNHFGWWWDGAVNITEQILALQEGNHEKLPENIIFLSKFFRNMMADIVNGCQGRSRGGDRR